MNIVMTKTALLEHLEGRLKVAKTEDDRRLKEHRLAERASLEKFRAGLRAALKFDYATAKKNYHVPNFSPPSCPISDFAKIKRVIQSLSYDMRKANYSVKPGTDLGDAFYYAAESERPKKSLCND